MKISFPINLCVLSSQSETRNLLNKAHADFYEKLPEQDRFQVERCNRDDTTPNEARELPEENNFLEMANFLEYVQMTSINENSREDAIKFFNVSTAAFEFGSYLVAQEGFGRAASALENFHTRRRRSADSGTQPVRGPIDIWDPADLFLEFRRTMGNQNFNQLLHLKRKVRFNYFKFNVRT